MTLETSELISFVYKHKNNFYRFVFAKMSFFHLNDLYIPIISKFLILCTSRQYGSTLRIREILLVDTPFMTTNVLRYLAIQTPKTLPRRHFPPKRYPYRDYLLPVHVSRAQHHCSFHQHSTCVDWTEPEKMKKSGGYYSLKRPFFE